MFLTCNQMEPWFGMLEVVLAEWLRRKSLGFRNGEVLHGCIHRISPYPAWNYVLRDATCHAFYGGCQSVVAF